MKKPAEFWRPGHETQSHFKFLESLHNSVDFRVHRRETASAPRLETQGRRCALEEGWLLQHVQVYPTYHRFYAKAFLTEALSHFGGAARRCRVDNTSVVVAAGTGKNARIAAEMEAFGERFGFHFAAHALGHANRSARVERPFAYIERGELVPLPLYVPEVYALHTRMVDVEGLIHLHTNRYSVEEALIGRRVQVRESLAQVRIFVGPREVACHARLEEGAHTRSVLPEHRHRASRRKTPDRLTFPFRFVLITTSLDITFSSNSCPKKPGAL